MIAAVIALVMAWESCQEGDTALRDGLVIGAGAAGTTALVGTGLAALLPGGGLLTALGGVALSVTLGMYARKFLTHALADMEGTHPQQAEYRWHLPSSEELDALAQRIVDRTPRAIPRDIADAINHRLNAST